MKRLFCLLLTILMLCGCGADVQQTQPPTEEPPATATEPSGFYNPDSTVEMFTGGAVRAYPLDIPDVYAIAASGRDLLVFSGLGSTKITRLSGENLYISARIQLDVTISPGDPGVLILEDRVVYYDENAGEMVYLDASFREFNRLRVPTEMTGAPVLSADCRKLYYCTGEGIRVLDVEQGISRLLKQTAATKQNAASLLMEDTVLRCFVSGEQGWEVLYLNVETGELLNRTGIDTDVYSGAGLYYAYTTADDSQSLLFGRAGERTRELLPLTGGEARFLPNAAAALVHGQRDGHWMLDYYDLNSGCLSGSVQLPETVSPWQYACDPMQNRVYFLSDGEAESEILYRWDVDSTRTADETIYTDHWYTQENPDVEGLEACQSKADALGQRYGLDICLWQRALEEEPWDYQLTAEYRTGIFEDALLRLEMLLSDFPEDFFVKAMEGMDGGLHLCLVRSLSGGEETGSLDSADGIQFWKGSDAYVVLAMGERFEKAFYHELFHALETRALSRSIAYYRWDEINPKGFKYDNDYVSNRYRDGSEYLEDDTTRAFIDVYSMSFAREDRARIFEYACMDGNERFFRSATMQKKLRTLCEGIREAYDLEKSPTIFLWEQYLESPLAYEE